MPATVFLPQVCVERGFVGGPASAGTTFCPDHHPENSPAIDGWEIVPPWFSQSREGRPKPSVVPHGTGGGFVAVTPAMNGWAIFTSNLPGAGAVPVTG